MNYIREAEKYLWYYRDLQYSLKQMDKEIAKLKWSGVPKVPSAQQFDGTPHRQQYYDDMFNIVFKLQMYIESRQRTLEELKEIDQMLEDISKGKGCENYGKVLRMWYIEKLPKEEIAEALHYSRNSRQSIYELRAKAIRKFAIRKFGSKALKAI